MYNDKILVTHHLDSTHLSLDKDLRYLEGQRQTTIEWSIELFETLKQSSCSCQRTGSRTSLLTVNLSTNSEKTMTTVLSLYHESGTVILTGSFEISIRG